MDRMTTEADRIAALFIQLAEKIANAKTLPLDMGDGMVFYRGEIHIVKMIGNEPGISASEIARRIDVTRAVVHKTLLKLDEKGVVRKLADPLDGKRVLLYLTAEGELAYAAHERYHRQQDAAMNDFLGEISKKERHAIWRFLQHADSLLDRHLGN